MASFGYRGMAYSAPTIDTWLKLPLEDDSSHGGVEVKHMAQYLCKIAVDHEDFVFVQPPIMTCAPLLLSRGVLAVQIF